MTIGIKYDWRYRDLPDSGNALYQATKGAAHDARFAQATGRNLNYALANKTAPVLLSGYDGTNNYWSADATERVGPRGRAILWPPYKDIAINFTARYRTSSGTIKIYVTDTPWTGGAAGSADKTVTLTINNAAYTEFTATITDVPATASRMIYIYTLIQRCEMESWIVYASPYEP